MPCSIIIPSKDRPTGLRSAVSSAIEALPTGGEIIVVDDGCRTPATEVLASLACAALRVVTNPGPHGPSGARNYGVSQSREAIIFFLDDDDKLMPNYCRTILALIPTLPGSSGCGFSAAILKTQNRPDAFLGRARTSGVLGPETPLDHRLTGLGTGFWVRREIFLSVGGLDPELRVNEDTEFSLRLSAAGVQPYYHSEPGVVIFHDPVRNDGDMGSITRSANAEARAAGFEYILRKHEVFLRRHGAFRRKFMLRVLKYRSRARDNKGWDKFCSSLRPSIENTIFCICGRIWLRISIALREVRSRVVR